MSRIEFHPATPERWSDMVRLFGANGACGGCWCMFQRLRGAAFTRGKGEPNRRALQRLVSQGKEPGLLASAGKDPIGWLALAPRAEYPRIEASRLFAGTGGGPDTWAVSCFFVARAHRRRGLGVRLLRAAIRHARERGARVLEGYPSEPRGATADAFVWTGLAESFRRAGFTEVAGPSPTRPLMRRVLRGPRG
jgi:GNAT superfamily N-acetyltransferase